MNLARIPRSLKILAALYLTYLALVLLIAMPVLNIYAPKIYREQTGAELKLDKLIWLNPFTLSITARQVSSANVDRSPFWSCDELQINISLASLWRRHLVLDAFALQGLDVQIDQTAPERFNFTDILDYRAKRAASQPEKANVADSNTRPNQSASFAIDIARLDFTAKHLGYRAAHTAEPMSAAVAHVSLVMQNLSATTQTNQPSLRANDFAFAIKSIDLDVARAQYPFAAALRDLKITVPILTTAENSDYEFSAVDGSGGNIDIKGSAAIARATTEGRAQLHNISVLPAWQYLAGKLAFDMKDAKLDGDAHYGVDWVGDTSNANAALKYRLDHSQFALREVQLQARNDSESRVGFSALQFSDIEVDSAQPRARIGKVSLDKLAVAGWNQDTHVSLIDMFAYASNDEPSNSPPWQIQIDDIALQQSDVRWHASQIDQLPLAFTALDIHISNVHWPDAAALQLDAKTTLNDTAQLAFNGALTPSTKSGEVHADIRNLPLIWGDVFVRQQMRATLASGSLNAGAAIKLDNGQAVSVQSDGAVDQFELRALTDTAAVAQNVADNRKLASWKKLEWQQLVLAPSQQRVHIKQIVVTQPWAQFRINTDGTNNFQQLMLSPTKTPAANKSKVSSKSTGIATAGNISTNKKSENINSANTSAANVNSTKNKPWQYAIDNIHVDNANIDFRDASLSSAFRTNITALSGDISGLDSNGNQAAKVGLKGTVDGYAPVALSGTVNPFAAKPALNVTLDMTNIDLAMLTPYSGTYAGYQIDGGRLTVQMAYTLENDRIKGTNHIIVNQMKLGKQVSGPKVMDLPLRLAIYLLTDSNGVMDLGVDVAGNVDDPDFSVGSIIWKAFRNLIVKAVTSPFRALGHLIGENRDDLDRIEFQSGSNQFAAGEHEKLESINKALQQKSALKLSISGHVSPSHDLEALRDNTLSSQLIADAAIKPADIQQQSKNWQHAVENLFKKRFPGEKIERWQVMQMNDAMRDNIELAADALQQLAAQRALAVKQTLVTDFSLAADRAFVKPVDLGADKNPGTTATLAVE